MTKQGGISQFTIAVDAMGGDFAPGEIVKGAVQAARAFGISLILTGVVKEIEKELSNLDTKGLQINITEATDVIRDGEEAAFAVFRRPNNSVGVATRLVKDGKADAVVSAGNTGASMVCAVQYLGTLPGIERPIAGGAYLSLASNMVMMDLGANVGVKPHQLVNFAVAGSIYVRIFHGVENPTIGLLSIGAEEGKGNEQTKEAYQLLKKSGLNFIGNVEGMDIVSGKANVIVCDGFIGNVLIKYSEGLGHALSGWLGKELKDMVPVEVLEETSQKLYRLLSPAVAMGGGPLVGVNGVAAVAHGNSCAAQVVGTIKNTIKALETGFVNKLRAELEKFQTVIS
ncbi:phosphate acyltransferase PlsX [Chloroflexota bacterium]